MAKTRRKRAGRDRKMGPRHRSNGRLKYERTERLDMTPEQLMRRISMVGVDNARSGDAGWYIGRLYLKGLISEGQRDAAERWQRVSRRYEALLLVPKPPTAAVLDMPKGERPDNPEEFERVKAEYELCYDAVASCGRMALRAVVGALREDMDMPLEYIREGLEALRHELKIAAE